MQNGATLLHMSNGTEARKAPVTPEGARAVVAYIEAAVKAKGDTLNAFADRAGISPSQLSNWRNAKTGMQFDNFVRITEELAETRERMMRVAGMLPASPEELPTPAAPTTDEDWLTLMHPGMSEAQRRDVLDFLRYKLGQG